MTRLYSDHSELYDIAFDWDVGEEVDWLLERLGSGCASVLEPGCGSGRMMEAFARRGVEVVGIDLEPAMVEAARARLANAGVAGEVVLADMAGLDLGRRFDGAVCPIGTLGHLPPAALSAHLDRMGEHLAPAGRYLVQLFMRDPDRLPALPETGSAWEEERGEVKLRITCTTEEIDLAGSQERQRLRIEILAGPDAGEAIEEELLVTAWTPATWDAAIAGSPFERVAVYDGWEDDRPEVPLDATGNLLWHELRLSGG